MTFPSSHLVDSTKERSIKHRPRSQLELFTIQNIKKMTKLHLFHYYLDLPTFQPNTKKAHPTFDLCPGFNAMMSSKAKWTFFFSSLITVYYKDQRIRFNSRSDPKK